MTSARWHVVKVICVIRESAELRVTGLFVIDWDDSCSFIQKTDIICLGKHSLRDMMRYDYQCLAPRLCQSMAWSLKIFLSTTSRFFCQNGTFLCFIYINSYLSMKFIKIILAGNWLSAARNTSLLIGMTITLSLHISHTHIQLVSFFFFRHSVR